MDNCKEIQSRIESFEHGNLSLKDEEAFTNHILNCADCREEMEIYYIIFIFILCKITFMIMS